MRVSYSHNDLDFFDIIHGKEKTGRCCVRGCRSTVNRSPHAHAGKFCRRCRDRRYKLSNPISYAWDKLRWSAKKRKIKFALTIAQFRSFCKSTRYDKLKGKEAGSLSVDRIDPSKGYEPGNIQVLTLADNSRKAHVDAKLAAKYGTDYGHDADKPYAPGEHPFE